MEIFLYVKFELKNSLNQTCIAKILDSL